MNFFLLYVPLQALLFGRRRRFRNSTTLTLGRSRRNGLRQCADGVTAAGLNVFVIARQYDTWGEPASVAVLIGAFASVVTLTSAMWLIKTGQLVFP